MDYEVVGTITIHVSYDVKADSEEAAIKSLREDMEDFYHLKSKGAYHDTHEMDLTADEYTEE